MKVLIVSHSYITAMAQRKIEALAQHNDIEITLVVPTFWRYILRDILLEKRSDDRYRIVAGRVTFSGRINGHFYWPGTFRALRGFRPDVLHIEQEPISLCALQWLIVNHLCWRARTVLFTWENQLRRSGWRRFIETFSLSHADHVIAGNTAARDVLRQKGYRRGISVVPLTGIDGLSARSIPIRLAKDDEFVIGYAGRLVREKGLLDLVKAVAGLPQHAKLLMIGKGPLRDEIETAAARLNMQERLMLVDSVPHDQVAAYLSGMNVFVLPSRTTPFWLEQFGRVLIEAMACDIPVVGSSSGAIPEVIGDAGLIFPESDVTALHSQLARLLDDPMLRESLKQRGRTRVLAEYTNDAIAHKTIAIYRKVLA